MIKLARPILVGCIVSLCLIATAWSEPIITSDVDDREHRYLELDNGLKVLLIHDASADKAAAALDVYTGSADNPADRAGLAHFLEHMLFLGTKKYPESDEYQAFISANGGGHNAYTALEHTNYFFDIRAGALEPALDRFAQFFIAPLFTPEYVTRERNAVDSEYSARIKDDMRRSFDALREVVNPEHPAAQFSVGSNETLADRDSDLVRDDLLQFYKTHYSSENMALVVLGRESLDDLQAMVVPRFSQVPRYRLQAKRNAVPMFKPESLPQMLSVVPVKETRSLGLLFPVPLLQPYYRKKPLEYIANLVGHEGQGSILNTLKQQGWAESLSAGSGLDDRYSSSMMVNISLTKAGWQHREEVIGLFFAGIDQIKRQGLKRWRYKEQQQLAALDFRYQEKQDPQRTVSYLASQLQEYPAPEVYQAGYLYEKFDKSLIKQYLDKIAPDNLFLLVLAPEVKADKTSQYYDTPYAVKSLKGHQWPSDENLVAQLTLPPRNEFIPKQLALLEAPKNTTAPTLVTSEESELWYQTDVSYAVPRGLVMIRTMLPAAAQDVQHAAMLAVYERMVEESLNAFSYPATLAGLNFGLSANTRGLDVQVGGYTDKQEHLLEIILSRLTDFEAIAPQFERVKAQVIREWRNANKRPPYAQLYADLSVTMFTPQWSSDDRLAALSEVTLEDMKAFTASLYQDGKAKMLVYGNFDAEQAQRFTAMVDKVLTLPNRWQLPPAKVVKLDTSPERLWLTVEHPDQALIGYLQGAGDSLTEQAHQMLLQQVLSADFFNDLRTEQQLGYIVFASNVDYKKVPGIAFVVQSPKASVEQLSTAVATFLADYTMPSDEQLEQHKEALLVELLQKPKNLREQGGLYWDNIVRDQPTFDLQDKLAEAISAINLADFSAYYQSVVIQSPRWLWLAAGEADELPKRGGWLRDGEEVKKTSESYVYP
ncbi:insulinase family protein [Halioxenophilus aromaticivorans]|uniref:Protease 3 n=1 Tax=Halioxenophilus aromaticivorans TaxID=1306992 RepID=A0AAV3TZW3_9ALTE